MSTIKQRRAGGLVVLLVAAALAVLVLVGRGGDGTCGTVAAFSGGRVEGQKTALHEASGGEYTVCILDVSFPPGTVPEAILSAAQTWPEPADYFKAHPDVDLFVIHAQSDSEITVSFSRAEALAQAARRP